MPKTLTPQRPDRRVAAPKERETPILVDGLGDQRLILPDLSWEQYVTIDDAIVERPGVKTVYCDGRFTLLTESRKHGWCSRCLFLFTTSLAQGLKIPCEVAASATFRRQAKGAGVEGDETFYFGKNAEVMKGSRNIDLTEQPPPDLTVEVEVSHSADDAVIAWGRLGVPEVWRFDPIAWECSFWARKRDGSYDRRDHSLAFPMLTPDDVLQQMKLADELGMGEWYAGLGRWVRKVIVPRARRKA